MVPEDKKKMMGSDVLVPLSYSEDPDPGVDGVPFAWGETKPVDWFVHFFRDCKLDHIFDTTVGSCAAAIGAFYANLQYDGVCCNPLHKAWCEQLMNRSMFAVLADGGANADKEYISKVLHFFGPAVDEGMRMIKADDGANKGATKKSSGDGDGDDDEEPPEDDEDEDGF